MAHGGLRLVTAMLVATAFGAGCGGEDVEIDDNSTADFVIDLKKGNITPAS